MSAKITAGSYPSTGRARATPGISMTGISMTLFADGNTDFNPIPSIPFWNLRAALHFHGPGGNDHLLLLENIRPIVASSVSLWFELVTQLG